MADYTVKQDVGNYTHVLDVDVASQSTSTRKSTIKFTYYVTRDVAASNGAWTSNAVRFRVNRDALSDAVTDKSFDFRSYQKLTIDTGTFEVTHDSNGNRTLNIGFNSDSGASGYFPAAAKSQSFSLPRIAQAPPAPTITSVSNITDTEFRIAFDGNGNGGASVIEWQVQRSTTSNFSTGNAENTIDDAIRSYTFGPLANHEQYWARVRGRNVVGWGDWSNVVTATTKGNPSRPDAPTATPSTTKTGRITVTWSAPTTTGAGGITGYNIFRNGNQIATTTGTGRTYVDDGRTPYVSFEYQVAARNAWSDSIGSRSGGSLRSDAVLAPGPPSAPGTLTATSSSSVPGQVTLSWTAPATTGGTITGYTVRYADNTQVAKLTGTGTSYTVNGLTPGLTYSFKVHARNALADAEGSESAASNTATVTPVGEPPAPSNFTVTSSAVVPNRLVLSWTAPAAEISGYSIFRRIDGADTLVATVRPNFTQYELDNLSPGTSYTYVIRSRTVYTDTLEAGYPGNWGGPASPERSAIPNINSSASVPSLAIATSTTNALFAGTYVIDAITATTIRYARVAANVPYSASGGTVANNTNPTFNGTYTISAATSSGFSYAKVASDIALGLVSAVTATNNTNTDLNGTFTVSSVNVGANLLSFTKAGADISSRAVPVNTIGGTSRITNLSNAVFNGTGKVITAITEQTISYAQTNANIAETNAAGTVTNTTNRDIFNGVYAIKSIPEFDTVHYTRVASNIAKRTWKGQVGEVSRVDSPSTLDVKYRSGWAG